MLDPSLSPLRPDPAGDAAPLHPAPLNRGAQPHTAWRGTIPPWVARIRAIAKHAAFLATPARAADRATLSILLVADVALIAAFLAYAYAEHYGLQGSLFYGNVKFSFVDGGYPEIYGYGKEFLVALLLLSVHAATRQPVYLGLSLLFAASVADDSLALHEGFGAYLSAHAGLSNRAGELVAWGMIGLFPVVAVLIGYLRSDRRSRTNGEAVVLGFGILLFFAVGMDAVHGIVHGYLAGFQTALTLLEDGGELFTLTLLCAVTLGIFRRRHDPSSTATTSARRNG